MFSNTQTGWLCIPRQLALTLGLAIVLCTPAVAQEDDRVAELEARVAELEAAIRHSFASSLDRRVFLYKRELDRSWNVCGTCGHHLPLPAVRYLDLLLDGDVLNRLADPLMHMLRNSVDHGIEMPQERLDKLREGQMQRKEKPRYDGHCRGREIDAGTVDLVPGDEVLKEAAERYGDERRTEIIGEQYSEWPWAPSMTIFSSRGPNPVATDIIKPVVSIYLLLMGLVAGGIARWSRREAVRRAAGVMVILFGLYTLWQAFLTG